MGDRRFSGHANGNVGENGYLSPFLRSYSHTFSYKMNLRFPPPSPFCPLPRLPPLCFTSRNFFGKIGNIKFLVIHSFDEQIQLTNKFNRGSEWFVEHFMDSKFKILGHCQGKKRNGLDGDFFHENWGLSFNFEGTRVISNK